MHRERACQSSPEPSGREEALRAFSRECHPQTGEPCWGAPGGQVQVGSAGRQEAP